MAARTVKQKLIQLQLPLPEIAGPFGAYVPAKRVGDVLHTAGQLPIKDGKLLATGKLGHGISMDEARECARQCVINAFAAAESVAGGVNQLTGVARVGVFVAGAADFTDQSKVADAASELLHDVFGEAGQHVRAAVGVAALPKDAPVEVEVLFTCKAEGSEDYMVFDAENDAPNPPSLGPDKPEKI